MIHVILIANAGVFLEIDGIRFLVDAFHYAPKYPFSMIPQDTFCRMTKDVSIYRNVDFVLFSHNHPDHYAPSVLAEYLRANHVRRVLLPEKPADSLEEECLLQTLADRRIPYWRLGLPEGKVHTYQLMPDVYLTAVGMQHTSEMFADSHCDCLMLSVRGTNVLFTSDCSFTSERNYTVWQGIKIDAAFVNPYFFHAEKGRHLLRKWNSRDIVVYHIPFEQDDKISIRSLAHRDFAKLAPEFQNVHLLWNIEEELYL